MEFPNSPYAVLHELLTQYQAEQRTREQFLASLDQVDHVLEQWAESANGVTLPEENPGAAQLIEATMLSLQSFADAANCLREYADTGDEAVAEEGMTLAAQGHQTLAQLFHFTTDAMDQLEG